MKQTLLTNIRLIAFGTALALTVSFAHATMWTAPTGAAPTNNTDLPINISNASQIKGSGDLGALSVENLLVLQSAAFQKDVFFNGFIHGGVPGLTASTVAFGATYTIPAHKVDVNATGSVSSGAKLRSTELSNTEMKYVCANAAGELTTTCPPTVCPNGTNPDGSCIVPPTSCTTYLTFSGGDRWGTVRSSNPIHPKLDVTVTLVGDQSTGAMTGNDRLAFFTILENSSFVFFSSNLPVPTTGSPCNNHAIPGGIGLCEIDGPLGFYRGYVSAVTPSSYGQGRICY